MLKNTTHLWTDDGLETQLGAVVVYGGGGGGISTLSVFSVELWLLLVHLSLLIIIFDIYEDELGLELLLLLLLLLFNSLLILKTVLDVGVDVVDELIDWLLFVVGKYRRLFPGDSESNADGSSLIASS